MTTRHESYSERSELEISVAAMETRLRHMITELLQPTIMRTATIQTELESLRSITASHSRNLQEVQSGQFRFIEQVSTIASIKEEMTRWEAQRSAHESSLTESLSAIEQKVSNYKYNLEQKESALHHLHRSVDRAGLELNRLQEAQDQQRESFEARLDEQSKRLNTAQAQTDVKITALEMKHHALTDELWSEETGLARVTGELKKTNSVVETLLADMSDVQSGKAERKQLDQVHADVDYMLAEAHTAVADMRQAVGHVVDDVKEHFRTASDTMSAYNARFVTEVRGDYEAELAQAAKVREEVRVFMEEVGEHIRGLDVRVADAASRASALAAEAREEVEELNKKRKRDKTTSENEFKALKKRLGGVFDNSDAVLRGIEHIYGVLALMLDSDFMQSSLEIQDSKDRKRIALMGVKDDDQMLVRSYQSEPQHPRPECRSKSAPSSKACRRVAGGKGANLQEPVVRVDTRCLSCSGQAPLVLSAFKMACLQYAPSPVEHDGSQHDRNDLLQQRHALLSGAHNTLHSCKDPMFRNSGQVAYHAEGLRTEAGDLSRYGAIESPPRQERSPHRRLAGSVSPPRGEHPVKLPNLNGQPMPVR